MSSKSPTISKPEMVDVLMIGPAWAACWGTLRVRAKGLTSTALAIAEPRAAESLVVSLGNGEWRETAEKIFGQERFDSLWGLSQKNFQHAHELAQTAGLSWPEEGTVWAEHPSAKEPGLVLRRRALEQWLASHVGEGAARANWDWRIKKNGSFDFEVAGIRARTICLVGDRFRPELFPFLRDKWIPCTLSSFTYPAQAMPAGSYFLFNGGVDYAVKEGDSLRVGSFRDLFEDKGVGFHDGPNEVTRVNCEKFFSTKGWIAAGESTAHWEIATLSCDGLPIIGPFPEEPGVLLVGGFSGRGANFLFAVLENLADALAARGTDPELEPYSTKRFA